MAFFDANYNITKLSKNAQGEITELEINGKSVTTSGMGLKLYAWGDDSHIYTKQLFTENTNDVTTYGGEPLTKATTGDYHVAELHDIWMIGKDYYNADLTSGSLPDGTKGISVKVGDVHIATAAETDLTEGTWYSSTGSGASKKWFVVEGLTTTSLVLGDEVTDEDAIAALEEGQIDEVSYVPFSEDEYILYSASKYYRDDTNDITL